MRNWSGHSGQGVSSLRWSGGLGRIGTWGDIRLPEPAEFLGWGDRAIDLQGQWRRNLREKLPASEGVRDKLYEDTLSALVNQALEPCQPQ